MAWCRARCSWSWSIRIGGVSIGSADTVWCWLSGLCLSLSLGTTKTRALKQVLLLARCVFCADLLAVDALNGKTLFWGKQRLSCQFGDEVVLKRFC